MTNNHNSVQKFDPDTLKQNLRSLMKAHDLNQEQFGEILGVSQSRASHIMNKHNSGQISVGELADLAMKFHVSVDDLMGIEPTKIEEQDVTLFSIMQTLFDLDEMAGLRIASIDMSSDETVENESVYAIFFNDMYIDEYLQQWYELNACSLRGMTKMLVLQNWKDTTLNQAKGRRKEWAFRNLWEQKNYLADLLATYYITMMEFYKNLPDNDKPKSEKKFFEYYTSKETTVPLDLLKPRNRELLERELPSIKSEAILPVSELDVLEHALEWLLNNTEAYDF